MTSQKMLDILQKASGNRELENLLLGYDCFDFQDVVKELHLGAIKNKIGINNDLIILLKQLEGEAGDEEEEKDAEGKPLNKGSK